MLFLLVKYSKKFQNIVLFLFCFYFLVKCSQNPKKI